LFFSCPNSRYPVPTQSWKIPFFPTCLPKGDREGYREGRRRQDLEVGRILVNKKSLGSKVYKGKRNGIIIGKKILYILIFSFYLEN